MDEQLIALLTDIRDDQRELLAVQRELLELMKMPLPEPAHVHTPKDDTPINAPFWVCACGYVHDDERT